MADKLLIVKDNGLSGLAIQRIEAADAKTMLDVPVVDDTLSVAGAAADAKAAGDAIDDIKSQIIDWTAIDAPINTEWDLFVRWSTGEYGASSTSHPTAFVDVHEYHKIKYKQQKSTSSTTSAGMAFYDENHDYISGVSGLAGQSEIGYVTELKEVTVPNGAYYAKFTAYADTSTYGDFALYGTRSIKDEVRGLQEQIDENALTFNNTLKIHEDGPYTNGIYSTERGVIATQYKFGLSLTNPLDVGANTGVKLLCAGYYIRAFRLPETGTTGFDYTEYTQDELDISTTDTLTRIAFTIRKNPNDSTALTDSEIADIASKVFIIQNIENSIKEVVEKTNKEYNFLYEGDILYTNGIYTTNRAIINTRYTYGLSNTVPFNLGANSGAKISCEGYYIRAFRLPETGTAGFDYTEYTQDEITVNTTDSLTRIAFTIRKNPNDLTALTSEEIETIESLTRVYLDSTGAIRLLQRKPTNIAPKPVIGSPELYLSNVPSDSSLIGELHGEIYNRYDALCESFPRWIKKQESLGNDSGNNPINHYILRMYDPIVGYSAAWTYDETEKVNYWGSKTDYRRILLTAGVHGDEKSAVWALLYFIEELLNSNDKWAKFIKGNYILDIIPIICPWNYDNNSRTNANNINVNRDYNSVTQPETEAMTTYIESIFDDIYCAIDCHTTSGQYCYIASPETNTSLDIVMTLANQISGNCAENWVETMSTLGRDISYYPFLYGCMSVNSGTLPDYLVKSGITNYAATVEGMKFSRKENMILMTQMIKDCVCNLLTGFLTL